MGDKQQIGIIGGGAMAEAMIAGMTAEGAVPPSHIFISEHKAARCDVLRQTYHVNAQVGAEDFLPHIDVLVLAVKPAAAAAAMHETTPYLRRGALVLSIVAGLTMAQIAAAYPRHPIIRAMPNTPLAVGAGMSAYACSGDADASARKAVDVVLGTAGRVVEVKECDLDAVTGLSGSGPAYAFLMIEALTDGGVAAGLRHDTAQVFAAQTLLGAAQMVLDGAAPAALRAAVTSPAGTTAAGLRVMENAGVRAALIEAVLAAAERSKELGKQQG
ncbi:pyrroline-5-carboxylate reductase [Selenomonas flueggei]|uniref:Pyrroline-5-carboxylate reductase n=1 Tax=Selenomonas flueggei ATCC 43531 TaxID=638302 RepID=C4V5I7_9FIRM|nr:pyrroline-5-carboxylate reductase [Selenomonas flueggei]EEQ47852.1 pyrroline-5-carboxylate reductase [Selenomonas flueggei ATCC 43531]